MDVSTLVKVHSNVHDLTTFDGAKGKLQAHLDLFIAAHDYITVTAPPTSDEQIAWHTTLPFDVSYLLNGEPTVRQSTLASFVAEFVSAAQVVLTLAVADCTLANRYVYYVLANQDTLHDALENSMELRHQSLVDTFASFSGLVRGLVPQQHDIFLCLS